MVSLGLRFAALNNERKPEIFNPFSEPSSKSNLTLLIEEEKNYVNKLVLSLVSPVFEEMFGGEITRDELALPDKKFEDVLKFLLCIYPSTSHPVSKENLDAVLALSHEYQAQQFVDRCEEFALNRLENKPVDRDYDISTDEVVHFLYLAEKYGLKTLLEKCIDKMTTRNYPESSYRCAYPDFKMVSEGVKYRILLGRIQLLEPKASEVCSYHNYSRPETGYDRRVKELKQLLQ